MLQQYLPILVFILVGLGLGGAMLSAGTLLSLRKSYPQKDAPYECGFPEFESARLPFDVRFYQTETRCLALTLCIMHEDKQALFLT